MLGQLIPCGGGDAIPLFEPKLVVGRRQDCDIPLPFKTVSGKHCLLEFRDGYWHVRDLDSRNGVRVDGTRCEQERLLPGSVLWVAQHRYEVEYTAHTTAPPDQKARKPTPGFPSSASRDDPRDEGMRGTGDEGTGKGEVPGLGELIPCGGGDPIPLEKPKLLVGRSSRCDIMLSYPTVSGKHCELEFQEGYWFVRDLGSRNGTRVNGYVQQSKCLMPGDVLGVAKHRYEISYTPQADEPPPEENPFSLGLLEKAGLAKKDEQGNVPKWQQIDDGHVPKKKWNIEE